MQFVCHGPPSALVFAVFGGVISPPIFTVTLHAIYQAPHFPPAPIPNILPAGAGIALFQIWELRDYLITLLQYLARGNSNTRHPAEG